MAAPWGSNPIPLYNLNAVLRRVLISSLAFTANTTRTEVFLEGLSLILTRAYTVQRSAR